MTTVAAPFTREHFERLEEERLAVYASQERAGASARAGPSPSSPGDARTDYARDRDRIIHSRAFRRLKHKTQVFIPYEGDHFRTRLTHTIEVAQIARSVARALGLNEDLTEAIALGHDLGHTPFGHSGEYVLDRLLRESHPAGRRLQAQLPVRARRRPAREALRGAGPEPHARRARGDAQAHGVAARLPVSARLPSRGCGSSRAGTLEAQVGQLVRRDRAADARPRGRPAADRGGRDRGARDRAARARGARLRQRRRVAARLAHPRHDRDAVGGPRRGVARAGSSGGSRRRGSRRPTSSTRGATALPGRPRRLHGARARRLYAELREFVYRHIIHSFPVSRHDGHARRVLAGIFAAYRENPRLLPDDVLRGLERELGVRFLREVPLGLDRARGRRALPAAARVLPRDRRPHRRDDRQLLQHRVPPARRRMRREEEPDAARRPPRRADGPRPRRRRSRRSPAGSRPRGAARTRASS